MILSQGLGMQGGYGHTAMDMSTDMVFEEAMDSAHGPPSHGPPGLPGYWQDSDL